MPQSVITSEQNAAFVKKADKLEKAGAVQKEAGFSVSAASYPQDGACMAARWSGTACSPHRARSGVTGEGLITALSVVVAHLEQSFLWVSKLEHHDVLIRKTQAINQHAQQAFAPGPLSRPAPASAPWPGIHHCKLSLHTSNSLFVDSFMCLLTLFLFCCCVSPYHSLCSAIFLCP